MAQTLGSVAVGTVVKINESGSPVNYIVVHQGLPSSMYDASCNGTWVLRQDIYKLDAWNTNNSNALSGSDIISDMADMLSLYDSFIQSSIKTVKIPYCVGGGTSTIRSGGNGLQCQIFPLSGYEIGFTNSVSPYLPIDGSVLSYFNGTNNTGNDSKRIFDYNNSHTQWWLRSPFFNKNNVSVNVTVSGGFSTNSPNTYLGIIPAFILPQNLYVENDGSVVPYPSPSSITVPPVAMQGQPITVSWATAPGADSYILQRKADSGEWEQVYAGNNLTYTDTAAAWSAVQYQVCGVFSGVNGAFAQSEVITVLPASSMVISGTDGDLGTITSDISYSVATDTGNPISLTLAVNGAQVSSGSVGTSYASSIPVMDLPTGTNTIVITATVQSTSGEVTVKRTWTYTKVAQAFPGSGGVAQLTQNGQNVFPMTLAEAVKAIGGPWGGNLSSALNKLAMAATYNSTSTPKYSQVDVNLANAQAGDIVNLPVNGVMVPHIVVQVGNPDPSMYDSSCDGVWLLRQDIVENGRWNSTNVNTLAGSTIMTTMAGYVTDYDSTVQAAMLTVKIPYCVGGGNTTVNTLANGLECKMFPLSAQEIGCGDYPGTGSVPEDGAKLDYFPFGFDSSNALVKRTANSNYWLRSPIPSGSINVWYISSSGPFTNNQVTELEGLRPCFLLPTTFTATYYVDAAGNVYPSQEYTTVGDFYDLWGNIIPSVKIATGSYTGTGTYGQDNPNEFNAGFPVKFAFFTSGQGAISFATPQPEYKERTFCTIINAVPPVIYPNGYSKQTETGFVWYSKINATEQANLSVEYRIFAIG